MAFDAAPAVQAPMPGAGATAKSAGRQGDASDPFGALLAMLDGAQTEGSAPVSPKPAAEVPADNASQAESPLPTDAVRNAPAADAETPLDIPVSDPATLVAAMMVPTAATPVPVAVTPVAEAAAPAAAPPAAAVIPPLDLEPPVIATAETPVQTVAEDAMPAPTAVAGAAVADPTARTAEVSQPVPAAQATQAALPADAETPAPAPAAQAAPSMTTEAPPAAATPAPQSAPAPTAQPRMAAADKTADPSRADAAATEAGFAAASRAGGQGEQGQQFDADADGQPADAEASRQAQADKPAAPAPEAATLAAAAKAAPDVATPAVGATVAAGPPLVIAAQAALTPVRGMPETVAHLAAQMIQRLDGQTTRFDLTLNPQSLGRVDVRIEIGLKGALRARMAFDDAATAQEMSGRHTELRAALQSAGFDVPEGALSFDVASGGGGAFADRQDADRATAPVFQNLADTADQDPAAAVRNYFSAAGSSGVDIRV